MTINNTVYTKHTIVKWVYATKRYNTAYMYIKGNRKREWFEQPYVTATLLRLGRKPDLGLILLTRINFNPSLNK